MVVVAVGKRVGAPPVLQQGCSGLGGCEAVLNAAPDAAGRRSTLPDAERSADVLEQQHQVQWIGG